MSDKSTNDKRRCHRLKVELPASFKASDEHKNLSIASTIDVSAIGICLISKEKLAVGQELPLHVTLPDDRRLTLNVKVIWVKEEIVSDINEYKMGIKINDGMKADEKKFVKFVAKEMIGKLEEE